jgi:hypothetical protein
MKGKCTTFSIWDGAAWDVVTGLYSIGGGGRTREDIEDDDLLDCGAEDYRMSAPGAKRLNPINVEYRWDPSSATTTNQELLETHFSADALIFIKVKYPDTAATGEIWHVYIKELGDTEKASNDTVKRSVIFMPTGQAYLLADSIDSPLAPPTI